MRTAETPSFGPDWPARYERACRDALETAFARIPAYRDWRPFDPGPDTPTRERYQRLPLLGKDDLRRHHAQDFALPECNVAEALAAGTIEFVRTNGTSSEAVETVWWQPWWDASEASSWRLNAHTASLDLGDHPEALLASALSVGRCSDREDLSMLERTSGRFLYLNEKSTPLLWSDVLMDRMLRELGLFQPTVLEANPSYLARLALHAIRKGVGVFQPRVVILTYEMPSAIHLRLIQALFPGAIASSYGTTESAYVFMQCEHGRFHQNTQSCHVDFIPLRVRDGCLPIGRLVVTTFGNPWRYLLRFMSGDLGRLALSPCPCGRKAGLVLQRIEGREQCMTVDSEGNMVTEAELDESLSRLGSIVDYQVVQRRPDHVCCHVVPTASASTSSVASDVEDVLKMLYGTKAEISVQAVGDIPPTVSGKYRRVISHCCISASASPPAASSNRIQLRTERTARINLHT
jgi:phenylacetate-coenzyme A ligase PaaK-like adenylate-forming protein